eukprot:TRINITY_DN9966_c0_g1_i4.p1 TRINITY_DN9966_c0_g1~~TRINITY_DN9966_c0_g1_i4.p1  ORF type:complete len:251 (+),score=41.88 TRINITY_DN9966_c0_g1_i4:406-1158(+)
MEWFGVLGIRVDGSMGSLVLSFLPLRNGLSPSELLIGRKLKTKLPMLPSTLIPKTPNHSMIQEKETNLKQQQRDNYNQRHMAREAPPLKAGDTVFIKDMAKPGQVVAKHHNPRSYIIRTEHGNIRRNASHLVATPTAPMGQQQAARDTPQQDPANMTTTLQREPATITTQQPTPRSLPATTHTTAAPGTPRAIHTHNCSPWHAMCNPHTQLQPLARHVQSALNQADISRSRKGLICKCKARGIKCQEIHF